MRLLSVAVVVMFAAGAEPPAGYKLLKTVPVPGAGGWDYVSVDEVNRRVYLAHGTQVDVLDADSLEHKGTIPDTAGVHGIAVAPDQGKGFTSNGRSNNVTIFDLKTLKPLGQVATGRNPDAIILDPASKRVFAFNGGSKSASVIDAAEGKVVATIELGGRPEFAAADGKGHIFVNLEDKNEVLMLDADKATVLHRWPLAPGTAPSGMSIDVKNRRLFIGCHKLLVVVNADDGKVVATSPIGDGVDATCFDPQTNLVFASNRDGTVNIVREDSPDKYEAVGVLKTRFGSKTMGLDPKTHRLFIPAAEFKAAEPGAPRARPQMLPGTFVVLVYGK